MRYALIVYLLLFGVQGRSQGNGPVPPIILKLAATPKPVNTISYTNDPFIQDLPYPFEKTGATFLKTPTEVLAMVNGMGRVYRLDTLYGQKSWRRIDSTYFSGYNVSSLTFFADTTVWSFGGYGFWNNNGHLRYFVKSKFEWEVKPLNREIPHIFDNKDLYWLDTAHARLYMLGIRFINDAIKDNAIQEKELGGKTWCLDIRSGNWTSIGESPDTAMLVIAYSPWGMMTYRNGTPAIADFANNRYLQANASGFRKFGRFSRGTKAKKMAYFIDSTLYFGDFDQYIDSISFSRADFTESGVPIYIPFTVEHTRSYWLLAILPLLGLVFLWWKRRLTRLAIVKEAAAVPDPLAILDERDRSLLQAIYGATRNGRTSDIDSINAILGVTSKSLEVQKRQRSDALNAINTKMSQLLQTDAEVIIRTRSEQDGRTYYYAVNPDLLEPMEKLLNWPA